jgi:hypothetical protein
MKKGSSSRSALVGLAFFVGLALSLSVGSQQRVQTTQLTVRTPVADADPLAEWEQQYAEAMKVADELVSAGNTDHGRRLAKDLEALDGALRGFVRASERLRHKDRALAATVEFLVQQNALQKESRQYAAVSNALTVRHDSAVAVMRNLK